MNTFMLLSSFKEVTSVDYFSIIVISMMTTILVTFASYRLFQILQLSGYRLKSFFKWFIESKFSYYSRLFMLTFLSTAAFLISNVLLNEFFIVEAFEFFPIMFFVLFLVFFSTILFSEKQKTPLKYTKRMMRLMTVCFVLTFLVLFGLGILGLIFIPYLSFGLMCITPALMPVIVAISLIITLPMEIMISKSYIRKSIKKLSEMKDLKVIGITGSYGKTTLKNMLATILAEKYKVCATPENYNTPMGLSKTILNNLADNDEIFIAEMGARYVGDIKKLCDMVKPSVGVITGIGNQHLMTFGSVEKVIKTKSELAEFVANNKGTLFINTDSKNAKIVAEKYINAQKISILEQNNVFFENVEFFETGLSFKIKQENFSEKIDISLFGEHNISNLYLAVNIALSLGLSISEIKAGIEKIRPIPHRLELIKTGTYTIIDDSYNCSVEGSKAALNALAKFSGKKIVITPGIVELGKEQYNANYELGQNLANVSDCVIIDSAVNFKAIALGLKSENFDVSKIINATSLTDAVEKLNSLANKNDVVLFLNDLPDNYN